MRVFPCGGLRYTCDLFSFRSGLRTDNHTLSKGQGSLLDILSRAHSYVILETVQFRVTTLCHLMRVQCQHRSFTDLTLPVSMVRKNFPLDKFEQAKKTMSFYGQVSYVLNHFALFMFCFLFVFFRDSTSSCAFFLPLGHHPAQVVQSFSPSFLYVLLPCLTNILCNEFYSPYSSLEAKRTVPP